MLLPVVIYWRFADAPVLLAAKLALAPAPAPAPELVVLEAAPALLL